MSVAFDHVDFLSETPSVPTRASHLNLPDRMTCYWELKIEAFKGVRLEVGVATRRSIYRGGLNKAEVRFVLGYAQQGIV